MSLTICPYTLKPISQLSEKSKEHIIPDAIGGPDGFFVYAEKSENGRLNNAIDAPFANDDFVRMLATQHGVKTRSGAAVWNLKGKTLLDGKELEVSSEFGHESVSTKMWKPVVVDPETGKVCSVIGWGDEVFANLDSLKKNLERKHGEGNVDIQITERRTTYNPSVRGQLSIDLFLYRRALCKIAYLGLSCTFGDEFVRSTVGSAFRGAFESDEAYTASGIKDDFFSPEKISGQQNLMRLPDTPDGHHQIVAARLRNLYIAVVRLFGNSALSAAFALPVNSGDLTGGMIYSCSSGGGGIVQKDLLIHFHEVCMNLNR